MANIKDYVDDSGNPKKPEPKAEKQEAVQKGEQAVIPSEEAPEPDDGIPEKFKGKSAKDIVQMYQEVEKLAGKNASEAGEYRRRLDELQKTVDTLILQQTSQAQPEEEVDYFSDPKTAIEKNIQNNPVVKQLSEKLQQLEGMTAVQQLYMKHPDAAQIARTEEFTNWVQEETGRRELFKMVQNNDPIAADALLSDFKKTRKPKTDNQKSEVKKASTGATTGSLSPSSRKVYKRHDVIELMKTDPRKYQAWLKDDGRRAYAEGRVR